MRRGRRFAGLPRAGSESFIDVLSNTVGGLALLCILAALDAGNLRWRLFISEERPAATEAVRFVVKDDRIQPFEIQRLAPQLARLPPGIHRIPASPELGYVARVEKLPDGGATLELEAGPVRGEPVRELLAGRGATAERLRGLDPRRNHVFLYLAADSFDRYLELRALCRAQGLEIGWTPLFEPLRFSFGRPSLGGTSRWNKIEAGG